MIKWLKKILGLCDHNWDVFESGDIKRAMCGGYKTVGRYYHLRCKTCGKIKHQNKY